MGSGRVPERVEIGVSTGKGTIRASIGEGKIRMSTGNVGSRRVPER